MAASNGRLSPEIPNIPESFPNDLWDCMVEFSFPHMSGREGFEHHTITAAYEAVGVAEAALREGVVETDVTKELVLVAFLHDLGYAITDSPIYTGDQGAITSAAKIDHQEKSALLAQRFLNENQDVVSKHFTLDEQGRLKELIRVHDSIDEFDTPDFQDRTLLLLFNEVDSLAAIDMVFGKPSFPKHHLAHWMNNGPIAGRLPRFITEYSKSRYSELAEKLIIYAKS